MLRLQATLVTFLLLGSAYAQQVKQTKGNPCDQSRNRLNPETHKFSSDCDAMTYCSNEGICQPKGCRQHEFPFGYDANVTLPAMCPSGQFCPDEEDQCLPIMPPGSTCQLNRDDQCQPPSDRPDLEGQLNNRGAMCFKYACQWANITLGQSCEVENIVYIGYGPGGAQFPNVVSRDRCAPHLWCNAQTSVCEPMVALGQPCSAHKQCETYTCNTNNVCAEPPGTPLKIQIWQYIVTGIAIVFVLVSTSIGLFTYHNRTRAKKLREIRAYFKEQTSYRNSIISMHSHARSRLSMYSLHSQADSLAQFGALGTRESFEEDEYNDDRALMGRRSSDEHGMLTGRPSEERGLLGRRSSEEHPQHRQDSDDEGQGYVYHPHGGNRDHPPSYRPTSRPRDSWNPTEWGARR